MERWPLTSLTKNYTTVVGVTLKLSNHESTKGWTLSISPLYSKCHKLKFFGFKFAKRKKKKIIYTSLYQMYIFLYPTMMDLTSIST